jgi:16S rRNA (guanine527-N7)-methyltransferase
MVPYAPMPRDLALPPVSLANFRRALAAHAPEALDPRVVAALHAHYLDLARWNRAMSLIGPGTVHETVARHYGESLAALPMVSQEGVALDLGSGAGFPGFVIAAARPKLEMTLVESNGKKWSFLQSAARKAALPCRCLNVRVSAPLPAELPQSIDLVTARALKLPPELLRDLALRLTPKGRILLWVGEQDPELPAELAPDSSLDLMGSEHRRILSLARVES